LVDGAALQGLEVRLLLTIGASSFIKHKKGLWSETQNKQS